MRSLGKDSIDVMNRWTGVERMAESVREEVGGGRDMVVRIYKFVPIIIL